MSKDLILTFDLGTTGCKTILFELDDSIGGSDYFEYPIVHPKPDWAEQDPEVWWKAVCTTTKKVVSSSGRGNDIIAVVCTGQREGVVPVDSKFNALTNCIIWMDKRTIPEVERIVKVFGEDYIFEKTGVMPDSMYSLSNIKSQGGQAFHSGAVLSGAKG